jgi:outer membrane receptor for Fe3+-dicitrate
MINSYSYLKKTFFFLSFFFQFFLAHGQNSSIKGIVTDKESGKAIEDVFISVARTNNHTHSNDKGLFSFDILSIGGYELEFDKLGYEKQVLKVDLSADTFRLAIALISKALKLGEIAIAADRPVSAASSTYLSQVDFINRPKNSAQDMLRLVPGLFIAQHAGGGKSEQIFIRGFDCDHGTDVATYVDGIPVNMPSHGHGQGYADLHFLIPEVVEGMTIFKGTSSPFYGDFATGAAVKFKTLDTLPNNLIQLESGSVPRTNTITSSRALAMLKVPISNNNVYSYFAVDVINNRGFFDASQDFKRVNIFSKTTIKLNENSNLHFSVTGFGSSWNASGQIPERAVRQGLITRYGSIDPNEGGTTQRNNYDLTYTSKLGSGEFETQAYACTYRFKLFSNFTFFLKDPINGDMIEQDDNRTIKGLNAKYTVNHELFHMYNKFTIGTAFRADDIENQLWHAPGRVRLKVGAYGLIHERSNSVFVNEVFRFNDHFRAEVGLRYDYFIFDVEDLLPTDSTHQNYTGYNYQTALNPKINLIYSVNDKVQFFLNTGRGFHSNDARSSVQEQNQHTLPLAYSGELGTLLHINSRIVISAAVWAMDLTNELVYQGDDGTTADSGPSRRIGVDVSGRAQILNWLYADADLNISKSTFIDVPFGKQLKTNFYIPLAPVLTSAGGLTAKFKNGLEFGARYRFMQDRPANESNSIVAHGYTVVDFTANYKTKRYKVGLLIENLTNVNWNEAQFATDTRLRNETKSVDELHFTPGTPFYAKVVLGYTF